MQVQCPHTREIKVTRSKVKHQTATYLTISFVNMASFLCLSIYKVTCTLAIVLNIIIDVID